MEVKLEKQDGGITDKVPDDKFECSIEQDV